MNGCNQFRFHFRGFCLQINFKDFENEQSVCQLVNRQVVGWLGWVDRSELLLFHAILGSTLSATV